MKRRLGKKLIFMFAFVALLPILTIIFCAICIIDVVKIEIQRKRENLVCKEEKNEMLA